MSERKTFTIRMRPELIKSLKMMSVEREANVSDLIEEAVEEMLKKAGHEAKKTLRK